MRRIFVLLSFILISNIFAVTSLQKVSLQLKWKHAFQFAGYYIAKEKGFYRSAGLYVDIKSFNHQDIVSDVVSGKTTYGILESSLILKRSEGAPVVALAAIFQNSPLALMTLKDSNITKISDLKGKKIMATREFFKNPYIKAMFFANMIDPKNLKKIPASFNLESLINKKIDAYAVYTTDQPYTMKNRGIEYNLIGSMNFGANFYSDILFTSQEELDNHPKRVRNFLRASLKGWRYAFSHIDETIKLIQKKYNSQYFSYDKLKFEAMQMKKLSGINSSHFGKIEKNKLNNIITMYGIVGENININNLKDFVYHLKSRETKLSQKEINYLHNTKKVVTMCIDPNWMPLEMIKEGNHVGISAEYLRLVEKYIGIPIKLIPTKNWTQSLAYAKKRKCDILSLVASTKKRKRYLNFTKPYLSTALVLVTKLDKLFVNNLKSIISKKLGVTRGYGFIDTLRKKYPNINLVEVDSIQQGLKMVNEEELYGFIDTFFSAGYEIQKSYFGELKIAGKINRNLYLGIGVRKDDSTLLDVFNKAINSISEKQKQNIINHWISVKYYKGINYTIFLYIGIFILIGAFLFISREITFRKYNKILEAKNRELEILASTDALTGTKSRRNFFDIGEQYILMAKRENIPLSFIMLDIDYFKKVNDTYGHMAGDEVLKNFTKLISKTLRKSDIFGRVGGEEFAIILHNADKNTALQIAAKIRKQINDNFVKFKDQIINITVSLGVAVLKDKDTLDSLFNEADKALYISKQNGRNQVTTV